MLTNDSEYGCPLYTTSRQDQEQRCGTRRRANLRCRPSLAHRVRHPDRERPRQAPDRADLLHLRLRAGRQPGRTVCRGLPDCRAGLAAGALDRGGACPRPGVGRVDGSELPHLRDARAGRAPFCAGGSIIGVGLKALHTSFHALCPRPLLTPSIAPAAQSTRARLSPTTGCIGSVANAPVTGCRNSLGCDSTITSLATSPLCCMPIVSMRLKKAFTRPARPPRPIVSREPNFRISASSGARRSGSRALSVARVIPSCSPWPEVAHRSPFHYHSICTMSYACWRFA